MIISSVIYLVIGLVLIIWPDAARQIIIYAIGAAALLYGGYRIVDFFVRKEHLANSVQLGVALEKLGNRHCRKSFLLHFKSQKNIYLLYREN